MARQLSGIPGPRCARSSETARAEARRGSRREAERGRAPGSATEGAGGPAGAGARWGRKPGGSRAGEGDSTAPPPPGRARAKRRRPLVVGRPPGGSFACCHGPALTPGRAARSLTRARLLPPLRRRSPGEPESRRVPELAREGGNPGGRERGRAPALCRPRRPPFLLPQVHPRPQLSHLGNLGRRGGRVWHLGVGVGGRPWPGEAEEEEGGGEEEEEEEVSPKDPLRAVCPAVSIRTPSSAARRGPSRGWPALDAYFQLFSQLVCPRHPGVSSGRPGGRAPAGSP